MTTEEQARQYAARHGVNVGQTKSSGRGAARTILLDCNNGNTTTMIMTTRSRGVWWVYAVDGAALPHPQSSKGEAIVRAVDLLMEAVQ